MGDMPVACSLDADALGCRQSDLRSGVLAEAESVERLADGYRWHFRHAADLFARLGPLIDAERACCRFLRFAIEAAPDQGTVTLEITGPDGTVEILEQWLPSHR